MKAADVMTKGIVSVGLTATVPAIAKAMIENRISAVPVVDAEGHLAGIVSEGDLLRRAELGTEKQRNRWLAFFTDGAVLAEDYVKSHSLKAADVMTREVVTVSPDAGLGEIAEIFETRHIKRVPVVADGAIVGIVSRANLIQALAVLEPAGPAAPPSAEGDRRIRDQLADELGHQPWVRQVGNNIVVTGGVVHLWGVVGSESERDALRVAAERIPGVVRVEDHMTLLPMTFYPAM